MCKQCDAYQETMDGLKVANSQPACNHPHWSGCGTYCLTYVSCGKPCAKPCVLCMVWRGYGAMLDDNFSLDTPGQRV
jgi:hypothetical protein